MALVDGLTLLIGLAYYALIGWFGLTSLIWILWERRTVRPLEARINRLDYEIEEIEGHDFTRGETPESRALRKARDIDKLTLNDEEERIDKFMRTWGFFRVLYRDPYSHAATKFRRERERLQKRLNIVDS
tara:strand:+ start:85 stop:474 length:390 start_codon:yes stop_codon:yes gene_type:complete